MDYQKQPTNLEQDQANEKARKDLGNVLKKLKDTANNKLVKRKITQNEAITMLQYINYLTSVVAQYNEELKKDQEKLG